MTAHRFITDILSGYTTILVTRPTLGLSGEIFKQLAHHKNLSVKKVFDPNSPAVALESPHVIIHFAGFEKDSLAETLYHTSTLHRLMDVALKNRAKLILILPEENSSLKETAVALVTQFGRNFNLHYRIVAVPVSGDNELLAEEVIRTLIKNHRREEPVVVAPPIPPSVPKPMPESVSPPLPKRSKIKIWNWLAPVIIVFLVVWGIYLAQVGAVVLALRCGVGGLQSGNWVNAKTCGRVARGLSVVLVEETFWIPGANYVLALLNTSSQNLFTTTRSMGDVVVRGVDLGERVLLTASSLTETSPRPKVDTSNQLLLDQLAYLQSSLKDFKGPLVGWLQINSWEAKVGSVKSLVGRYQIISQEVARILQAESTRVLVLLQDNNELRATGGFLANFAIINIERGQIKGVETYATSATDELLRGQVEPPDDFSKATGEDSWYLRDSNWNPDFTASADRAAWFVNKEIGQKIDLVIGANWQLVNALLTLTGPIDSAGQAISATNLDAKMLELAKPGGTGKDLVEKVFNTAVVQWPKLSSAKQQQFLATVIAQLEKRQLLVSNSVGSSEVWNAVGWSGKLQPETCASSCVSDFWYVVDSNIGVNKANAYVDTTHNLQVTLGTKEVRSVGKITYVNSSRQAAWPAGEYKNYLRIYIPSTSQVVSLKVGNKAVSDYNLTTRGALQEVGVVVSVPTGSSQTVEISTTQPVVVGSQLHYVLTYPNQPGAKPTPLAISIETPKGWSTVFPPAGFVASGSILRYNSALDAPLSIQADLLTN